MAVTIRVLSWNIQTLGDAKALQPGILPAQPTGIIPYIAQVIRASGADLVGVMEIQAALGVTIRDWLVAELNNGAAQGAPTWQGQVSTRQDGGTQEEYLFLFKEEANRLVLDTTTQSGPTSLIGVVDRPALATLTGTSQWAATDWDALFTGLERDGYIAHGIYAAARGGRHVLTSTWRVAAQQWETLSVMQTPAVSPTGPPALTLQQRVQLAAILLDADILRFVRYADRSPFLGRFLVGTTPAPLLVVLYHAPGPQDKTDLFAATNIIGLSRPAAQASNLLVMGDFNADDYKLQLGRVYARRIGSDQKFGFSQVTPPKLKPVFTPIIGAPLNANALLARGTLTSLTNTYEPDDATSASVLNNTYDKFFHKGTGVTAANARVLNLIESMVIPGSAGYDPALGQMALTFYRAYRGSEQLGKRMETLEEKDLRCSRDIARCTTTYATAKRNLQKAENAGASKQQLKVLRRRRATAKAALGEATDAYDKVLHEMAAVQAITELVQDPTAPVPTGIGSAHAIYRHAISDHLAIAVELTA